MYISYNELNSDYILIDVRTTLEYNEGHLDNAINIMNKLFTISKTQIEGELIKRNPAFSMDDQLLLERIDYDKKTIKLGDKEYPLKHFDFPFRL